MLNVTFKLNGLIEEEHFSIKTQKSDWDEDAVSRHAGLFFYIGNNRSSYSKKMF